MAVVDNRLASLRIVFLSLYIYIYICSVLFSKLTSTEKLIWSNGVALVFRFPLSITLKMLIMRMDRGGIKWDGVGWMHLARDRFNSELFWIIQRTNVLEISGFRRGVLEVFAFLGSCEAYDCSYLPTLQDNVSCQTQRSCSLLGPPGCKKCKG